ncbi:hypothetical protein EMIHUDRAFT_462886 [Emiliania huxleyi CCMP1516]|uniref:Urease accessory protein UreH-like transmembrane domain-containing protein n=2 Tax=Emiliania huxleyi TaxID=2903 RepID=A0A0D3K2J3_EMIH1|nr:hypothetical protein EMIHUDRAFT_462886 [Emiliania huxleyi CCMP1516]EOD29978.1 hypothetical protein EMIHUDRAFT_462886 [Emiliania huxleyi CCMP1516]|eukprot:XP_005782407.1 hypothetical protein EMIHUDRAFT_462886 [Emiliania huxleyi CCMP1516]
MLLLLLAAPALSATRPLSRPRLAAPAAAPSPLLASARRHRHAPPRASLVLPAVSGPLLAAGIGGTFAGSLHAVTGPDHLAALLPLSIGRRWWTALYTGLYWGLGHGIGAGLVGLLAFLVRGALNLDAICVYMEAAVGISILIIGVNGVREACARERERACGTRAAREWSSDVQAARALAEDERAAGDAAGSAIDGSVAAAVAPLGAPGEDDPAAALLPSGGGPSERQSVASTLLTGILHGCSGSGHLLGVMPALAMPSVVCALTYLSSFGVGTMLAMSSFTAVVGELSVQMGERMHQPDVPAKLSLATSLFACAMGVGWTVKALLELGVGRWLLASARRLIAA